MKRGTVEHSAVKLSFVLRRNDLVENFELNRRVELLQKRKYCVSTHSSDARLRFTAIEKREGGDSLCSSRVETLSFRLLQRIDRKSSSGESENQ